MEQYRAEYNTKDLVTTVGMETIPIAEAKVFAKAVGTSSLHSIIQWFGMLRAGSVHSK